MRTFKAFLLVMLAFVIVLLLVGFQESRYHFGCSSWLPQERVVVLGVQMCREPAQPQNQAGAASEPSPPAPAAAEPPAVPQQAPEEAPEGTIPPCARSQPTTC